MDVGISIIISQSHPRNKNATGGMSGNAIKSGGEITNNAEADRIHSFGAGFFPPGYANIRSWDMTPRDTGAKAEGHKDRHSRLERVDKVHREADGLHREEGTDNDHDPVIRHSNGHAGAGNDGDIHRHHDVGCSHGLVAGRDGCCSSHRLKGNLLRDDTVATENDGGVHSEGSHSAPGRDLVKVWRSVKDRTPTSDVQRTLVPLKSWLSNFSTATFKSAAVSNSTNLSHRLKSHSYKRMVTLALCHRGHGRPRNRPHQGRSGGQSLSNPMVQVSPRPVPP